MKFLPLLLLSRAVLPSIGAGIVLLFVHPFVSFRCHSGFAFQPADTNKTRGTL